MEAKLKMNNNFKIKFGGQQNQIDANVLVGTLTQMTTIVNEINRLLYPDKKIDIKVKITKD